MSASTKSKDFQPKCRKGVLAIMSTKKVDVASTKLYLLFLV